MSLIKFGRHALNLYYQVSVSIALENFNRISVPFFSAKRTLDDLLDLVRFAGEEVGNNNNVLLTFIDRYLSKSVESVDI